IRSFFSNTVTSCPARASCWAQASPAGPEPTTATFLPVLCPGGCGLTQPSSNALSMIACSIDLMPTGSSLMRSTHASSRAAVHAARPLHFRLVFGETDDELPIVFLPLFGLLVRFLEALKLEESRDFPHLRCRLALRRG